MRHTDFYDDVADRSDVIKVSVGFTINDADYNLYTLNRFFAWYYFKAKSPDAYLKSLQTRHINQLLGA